MAMGLIKRFFGMFSKKNEQALIEEGRVDKFIESKMVEIEVILERIKDSLIVLTSNGEISKRDFNKSMRGFDAAFKDTEYLGKLLIQLWKSLSSGAVVDHRILLSEILRYTNTVYLHFQWMEDIPFLMNNREIRTDMRVLKSIALNMLANTKKMIESDKRHQIKLPDFDKGAKIFGDLADTEVELGEKVERGKAA